MLNKIISWGLGKLSLELSEKCIYASKMQGSLSEIPRSSSILFHHTLLNDLVL